MKFSDLVEAQDFKSIHWGQSIPFFLIHLSLIGIFWVEWSWGWFAVALILYNVRMFGITAGFHRYFSHRTYKTSRAFQFILAILGTVSAQKGVLWWAANHRHHHRFSDQAGDLHSPMQRSFFWSHVGWILSTEFDHTRWDYIKDLTKYPELVWLNKYHWLPPILLGTICFLAGGWSGLLIGFCLSTVLLWHGTFVINSLAHLWGSRRYETSDASRNNFFLALITLGEGWHNNHHQYMSCAQQGFRWYEVDVSYWTLKTLSSFGIVWELRKPPLELLKQKLVNKVA